VTRETIIGYMLTALSGVMENLSIEPRRISSSDRRVLEDIILPYFAKDIRFQKILFVGCAAYTRWYEKFFAMKEYWTIDYKKIKRKYGSPNHITDNITHVEKYFQPDYFDVIIMNGVIGYGLNHSIDIEAAIDACFMTLDRGGIFVLGWNDHKRRKPVEIGNIQALKKFTESYFDPLQTCHFKAEQTSGHTFSFYVKA